MMTWMERRSAALFRELFGAAGVSIGSEESNDVIVRNPAVYTSWLAGGSLALGESYVDGHWDAAHVDRVFFKLYTLPSERRRQLFRSWRSKGVAALSRVKNMQVRKRARMVTEAHYDLGNDFFRSWLDERMIYSCAFWDGAKTLEAAQRNKLDLIAQKLHLKPGMSVLDVGCGWGGSACYLAERYGVRVTAVNIAREQLALARENATGKSVTVVECDYRDLSSRFGRNAFDAIYSVGMFEHVGYKNYRSYMTETQAVLRPGGLALVHTIGSNKSVTRVPDEWIGTYIFPNGMLPSGAQLSAAAEKLFVLEDVQNLGPHYDRTLLEWHRRFRAHVESGKHELTTRFERMWTYYLLTCAAMFRARSVQLWQVVLSKERLDAFQRIKVDQPSHDAGEELVSVAPPPVLGISAS